ncbi:MAG TPA: hypothetical protein VME23_09890 [Terracidiphilus sp.]|jgi:hypothetical protein|nr:hypothetical protein [Terracidiphilus sp.]
MKTSEGNVGTLTSLSESTWESIKQPGAYIERETGHLYRVPPEALLRGSSPLISKLCNNPSTFVKLSDDPNAIVSKLRTIAADADVKPNF